MLVVQLHSAVFAMVAMLPQSMRENGRIISIIACTLTALACGTNVCLQDDFREVSTDFVLQYAYSAWAPQFAQQLKLSSTESNLIVRTRRPSYCMAY